MITLSDLTALSYEKKNDFSLFHLNINSKMSCKPFYQTATLIFKLKSRLKTDISTTTNIGFIIEHMPTKSANGGAILYIKDTISYKLRPDLNVEKEKELESIFIEIFQKNPKILYIIFYRHPCMYAKEFNLFLKFLTERHAKENNKEVHNIPKTLKYWVGNQWGQSYLMGRR